MQVDLRGIIFRALMDDPEIAAEVGDRIVQRGSWDQDGIPAPTVLPYIVYDLSNEGSYGPSAMRATRRFFTVRVHDQLGDYFRIDQILQRVKVVLQDVDQQHELMQIRFIEKSQDLFDDLLDHLVRYSRFHATLTE